MTAALSPELAIAYVRELSADVRDAVVLDATGARLAGPVALEGPARTLLAALGDAPDAVVRIAATAPESVAPLAARVPEAVAPLAGVVVAARGPERAIVAVAGPRAVAGPTRLDARAAVECTAQSPAAGAPSSALVRAAEAVLLAAQRAI